MKTIPRFNSILSMSLLGLVLASDSLCAGPNVSLSLSAASDQYVLVPASTNLPPTTNAATQITVEAWVNVPSAGSWTILSRGDGGNGALTDFIFQISNDGAGAGTEVSFFGVGAWDVSASSIPVSTWTHVAVTFDGTNKLFYINGVLNKTAARPGSLYATNSAMYIGRQGSACDCNFFTGQMAELRVWNTVRTASQISADMNLAFFAPQPGLVAYYHFNEGAGTTVNDASGNGHTGTLMNAPTWANSAPPVLGASAILVGPTAGTNSVVLRSSASWTATTNAPWLHLSAANQSGGASTNVVFSYDANTGPTRTGTLTIAGQTLTITQAGATYVAARPVTTLASGLSDPEGAALDGAGNVYYADYNDSLIRKWSAASNSVTTLVSSPGNGFDVVAVDGLGDVYFANNYSVDEWSAAGQNVSTVFSSGSTGYTGIALDSADNIYIGFNPISGTSTMEEWVAGSKTSYTLFSTDINAAVAVDAAGNVYFTDNNSPTAVKEWIAASGSIVTLASGLNYLNGLAVDGAGNVYIADSGNNAIEEWIAANQTFTTLYSYRNGYNSAFPYGVAVDGTGDVYFTDYDHGLIEELPNAFVDTTTKLETAAAGSDTLPVVLPVTENLLPPFAPATDQTWLSITGVTNGVVSFALTENLGSTRTAQISLLGQQIQITQSGPSFSLAATNRTEGPAAAIDSVVLTVIPAGVAWTATANASWLHLSAASQSGASSTNVFFGFDANTGATRTGTLTIAGQTLTITQAGSTYVAAPGPLTALVSSGLNGPSGLAVDGSGNVYFADSTNNAIKEWLVANNTVVALVSSGLNHPFGVALDASGDVYFSDSGNNAIKAWSASSHAVSILVSSGLNGPAGVAVDGVGNVYFADSGNNAVKEWSAASQTVTVLVSSGLNHPSGLAMDGAGNVYIADTTNNAIKEWSVLGNNVITLVSSGLNHPFGVAVDGAGNVYIADTGNSAVKEWSAAGNTVSTLLSSGLNQPYGLAVDAADNIYLADTRDNAVKEQPRAFVDPTTKLEYAVAGSDALPAVLPVTENLLPPFAPATNQTWLSIPGITNGIVTFAFTTNLASSRTAQITLLGQQIQIAQSGPSFSLGATNRVESPAAGEDSVILVVSPAAIAWTATANASWLHLSASYQSGMGSTTIVFSFDANTGAPRTGTLTIAGQTFTVSQAGSNYVAASVPITLVPNLNTLGVAVDGAGNVYFSTTGNEIEEWLVASNTVSTLVSSGLNGPTGVAVDGVGNAYFADSGNNAIKEWSASSHIVTSLVTNGLNYPSGVAVDGAGNVYIADTINNAVKEWIVASNTVATLVSSGLYYPNSVALDVLGNVYFADTDHNALKEWSATDLAVTTLASSGLNFPYGVAVDGAGNVYVANNNSSTISEWIAANNTLATPVSLSSGQNGVALDAAGNVYIASYYNLGIRELPNAYLLPASMVEGFSAGNDALPAVVPATENLVGPLAPVSNQPWLTITGVTNGVVSFAFSASASNRTGNITLLGQNFPVSQYAYLLNTNALIVGPGAGSNSVTLMVNPAASQSWTASSQASWLHPAVTSGSGNAVVTFTYDLNPGSIRSGTLTIAGQTLMVIQEGFALGVSARLEANTATTDSVVLASLNTPWTATANASWLHLSVSNQSGIGSTNVIFSVDANTNATRTGTLTIAGLVLTVTQAGMTYIPAPAPLTTLVSSNVLSSPYGVALDGSGNVYIADAENAAIYEWLAASNTITTLPISGLFAPVAVAFDASGNVYVADAGNLAVYEWSPASNTVTTLSFAGLAFPTALAVDVLGNVYLADEDNNSIYEWSPLNNAVTTVFTNNNLSPSGVAVDIAGNVYFTDASIGAIFEWSAARHTVTRLAAGFNSPGGIRVDGAGNVYIADTDHNAIKQWSALTHAVTTLVSSGLSHPRDVAVDGADNLFIVDGGHVLVEELPRAFIDPTTKTETACAGSDSLPAVLPATEDLLAPFAPASSQPWLTISGVTNGAVSFTFSANNTGAARTAGVTLLGDSISITQSNIAIGVPVLLTGATILASGSFQFSFTNTPGASFTVLSSTNVALPLSEWSPVGAPVEGPPGQYVFTGAPANSQSYYMLRSP
jgi:DNA-binding beta-propeller fold protein YncE